MTTVSLIATVCLGVAMFGIACMLSWRWHEVRRQRERGYFRRIITAIDGAVLAYMYRSGRTARSLSRRLERGVFAYLPELLLEFSVTGGHKCYIQYRRLLITLRGEAARRKRRSSRDASSYLRSLGGTDNGKNQPGEQTPRDQ
ncbi:MAG: hypothetical protein WDZ79_00745 [Candidatus Paceibacterota bacterium]